MLLDICMISEILGGGILIVIGLYIYFKLYVFTFWQKRGVYSMEPTFPTGNLMPLLSRKTANAEFFRTVYEQNKKHRLFGLYMLYKPYLMVTDLDLVRDVLTKEFRNFHDRGVFCNIETDPLSGNLLQISGKKWKNLRVKLTPTFTSGKIKQLFPLVKETGDTLANFLDRAAEFKESINLKDIFTRYSIDVIMSTAFGIVCDNINNPDNEIRYWTKKIVRHKPIRNTLAVFMPKLFDLFSMPYTDRGVTKFFTTLFRDVVEHRKTHDIARKDFINLLMQLMEQGYVDLDDDSAREKTDENITESKMTLLEAAAQAYSFHVGGFETSSTIATFCLYEVARNQDIQDKLREEMRTVVKKHGGITYNAVNDMPYLHKVISETMRKYPILVLLNRVCTKETTLKTTNVTIPVGTSVLIPTYGIHYDPNIYPEPEKFDPERFSEENIKSRHPYAYLPFGEGPRACIGFRFGLVKVKVAIINSLLNHRIKLTSDTPDTMEFMAGLILITPKFDVHINIETVT